MGVALQARLNHLQCGSVLVSGEEHTEGDLHCGWFVQEGGGGGGGGNMSLPFTATNILKQLKIVH